MIKVFIATVLILSFLGCLVFAQSPSSPTDSFEPAQAQTPSIARPAEEPESSKPLTDIHDIKPLVSVPVPISWVTVGLWTTAGIVIGILLWGIRRLWRRRRGPLVETVAAVLSPEETALNRLASLSAETGLEGKLYYFRLSFIFREYLEGRFGIDGLEMTTEELLPRVEKLALDRDMKRNAKNFIVSCDPVKYASAPTFQASMATDFAFVKTFVERTAAPAEDAMKTGSEESTGGQE